jgi:5-methylcytosine-specific restriction protein A
LLLPNVERVVLEDALSRFDAELRALPEWRGWEAKAAQKFALSHDGLRYPPKKIISMATGVPVSEFSGGRQSNEYLKSRGFEIITLDHAISGPLEAPRFVVGKIYDRSPDINVPYGGNRQSGISPSSQTPAIFLFSGDSGEQYGYRDAFDADGVFSYTGEGQVGDMQMTKGNLSITNHAHDGRALHVFESLGKSKGHKYVGEFTYVNHSYQRGPDREGNDRRIIVFHLVPVGKEADEVLPEEGVENHPSAPITDLAEARKRALSAFGANEGKGGKQAKKNLYIRSKAVRDYVLLRSNGECESCHEFAPFTRVDGSPYLEPHHTTRISDGGLDHPRFVGAICPTCHREIHHGLDGKRRNAELIEYLAELEPLT